MYFKRTTRNQPVQLSPPTSLSAKVKGYWRSADIADIWQGSIFFCEPSIGFNPDRLMSMVAIEEAGEIGYLTITDEFCVQV